MQQLGLLEPPPCWRPDARNTLVHSYFAAPVLETCHALTEEAEDAVSNDPDLSPGLNCCATCGSTSRMAKQNAKAAAAAGGELLPCKGCKQGTVRL